MTRKIFVALLISTCFQLWSVRPEGKSIEGNTTIGTKMNIAEVPGVYLYAPQPNITTYELALLVPVLMEGKLPRPPGRAPQTFPNGDMYQVFRFDYERLGTAARHLKVITEPSLPPKEIKPPNRGGAQ